MSESNGNSSRYAIYFCPTPETNLFISGSQWLGRNAVTGALIEPELPKNIRHKQWLTITDAPRRYGFHATLKPPFRLAEGVTVEELKSTLREFAQRHHSFQAPPLSVTTLGRFIALTLSSPSEELSQLAEDSVVEFDRFRAPATPEEIAQRLRPSFTPKEHEYTLRWGYPYVLDTWKFHMTLTGTLAPESIPPTLHHLQTRFAPICAAPLLVNSICLFHESYPGALFHVQEQFMLNTDLPAPSSDIHSSNASALNSTPELSPTMRPS